MKLPKNTDISIKLFNIAKISTSSCEAEYLNINAMVHTLNKLPDIYPQELRIYPLIYKKALKLGFFSALSENAKSILKSTAYKSAADQLRKEALIKSLIPKLAEHSLQVILLKGSAFSGSIYPDDYPRMGVDVDMLIKNNEKEKALEILRLFTRLIKAEKTHTFDDLYECSLQTEDGLKTNIDLHYHLTHPLLFTADEQLLWNNSIPHPKYSSNYLRILSPEDSLNHLATHVFKDLNFYHYNLLDAHEIICQLKPNIIETFKRAQQWGSSYVLYYFLQLCKKHLDTPIEINDLACFTPPAFKRFSGWLVINKLHRIHAPEKSALYRLNQCLTQLILTDKLTNATKHQLSYLNTRFIKN